MRQDGVMLEGLHRLENFLIVRFIVLFLAPPALEILCPEFFIVDLVHREQHKIQLILILGKESLIIIHRDGLDTELQPRADLDCIAIGSPYARYLSKVAGIIDVGERLARRIS